MYCNISRIRHGLDKPPGRKDGGRSGAIASTVGPAVFDAGAPNGRKIELRSMIGRRALLLLALAAVLLAACSGSGDRTETPTSEAVPTPQATSTPAPPPYQATFEEQPCWFELPRGQRADNTRCGYLTVPEDRSRAGGPSIRLAVAILKATGPNPLPDPVLYLSGGPGGPSLQGEMPAFTSRFAEPLQSRRDLVFYDQRGTGLSEPALDCPDARDSFRAAMSENVSNHEIDHRQDAVLRACHDRLVGQGIDPTAYSSAASADDVADLMPALGYRQWNLLGVSYGTRLALEVMRRHPEHLRSVVLDSTLPPQVKADLDVPANFQRSLDLVLSTCRAEPSCNDAYPDLESTLFNLVPQLAASPLQTDTTDPATGDTVPVVVNGDRLLLGTLMVLYQTQVLPRLPAAIEGISRGNTTFLPVLAGRLLFLEDAVDQGMATAVNCNEEVAFYRAEDLPQATAGVRRELIDADIGIGDVPTLQEAKDICATWGARPPNTEQDQPVVSDIPTLVLAGQFDPVTPPDWGRLAAQTLSRSYVFEFPGTGHGVIYARPTCGFDVVSAFLADPAAKPDATCIGGLAPLQFETGG